MTLVYRMEKGSPLSSSEIDGNFKELEERLKKIEDHPEKGEGIGKVQIQGDEITFLGTFGSNFGSFSLPMVKINIHGPWKAQTAYQKQDIISYEEGLYSCLQGHTSTTWDKDLPHWKCILSFPKPHGLSYYEKSTLPPQESLGKTALLMTKEGPALIFFNGKIWQQLLKGDIL